MTVASASVIRLKRVSEHISTLWTLPSGHVDARLTYLKQCSLQVSSEPHPWRWTVQRSVFIPYWAFLILLLALAAGHYLNTRLNACDGM
jgi:hypothetical protein